MTVVLVHGVLETPAVWNPLRSFLHRTDVAAVRLPGFGCPRPEGFAATKEEYVAWLVGELEGLHAAGPVDLVGHNWGGGLVVRVVSIRPDLVRSWVTDMAALGDADFEWHELAKVWQAPGAGEDYFERQLARPIEQWTAQLEYFGVPHDQAGAMAELDRTMVECLLALYRSAVNVGRQWAPRFRDVLAPGLVVIPSEDPFRRTTSARNAAYRSKASVVALVGLGHWWMLQDPARSAAMLEGFWTSLGR